MNLETTFGKMMIVKIGEQYSAYILISDFSK